MNLSDVCLDMARRAKKASQFLALVETGAKNAWLSLAADAAEANTAPLLAANERDLKNAGQTGLVPCNGRSPAAYCARVQAAAKGMRQVAALPDPIGRVREGRRLPNGLEVRKLTVPLGVIFFLYESRPLVMVDAARFA